MIAGLQPFDAEYEQAVMYSIINEDPEPLTGLRSGLPIEIDWVIAKCLTKDPNDRYPSFPRHFWSPDSRFIAFKSGKSLNRASVEESRVAAICSAPYGFSGGTWSPGGDSIVFGASTAPGEAPQENDVVPSAEFGAWMVFGVTGAQRLFRVEAAGGEPELLFEPREEIANRVMLHPSFVARGTYSPLLLYVAAIDPTHGEIFVRDLDTDEERSLTDGFFPRYSPSGHILYQTNLRGGAIWALPFSTLRMEPTGKASLVAERGKYATIAQDGTLAYVEVERPGPQRLVWRDRTGEKVGEIGQPQDEISVPRLAPDETRVGVEGVEEATGRDIWIHEIDRPVKTRLTVDESRDSRAIWSPDGNNVVFWSDRTGGVDMFLKPADGSSPARQLSSTSAEEWPGDWSPDGTCLVFGHLGGFWCMSDFEGGGEPKRTLLFQEGNLVTGADVSPNGKFLAYTSNESGSHQIYVRPYPDFDRRWQVSQTGGRQARWNPNGRELFYVSGDTLYAVAVETEDVFSLGRTARLFSDTSLDWLYGTPMYDVSSDGNRIVTVESIGGESKPRIRIVQNWAPR